MIPKITSNLSLGLNINSLGELGFYDVLATYAPTIAAGEEAIIIINADKGTYAASSNAIKVVIDFNANTCVTTKKVATVETELDSSAIVYGDAKVLKVLNDISVKDNIWVFYDGSLIYSDTVSDAAINSNKGHYIEGDGTGTFTAKKLRFGAATFGDSCSVDNTADWTVYDCTATFDVSHYEIARTANTQGFWIGISVLTTNTLYVLEADLKQGATISGNLFMITETALNGNENSLTTQAGGVWATNRMYFVAGVGIDIIRFFASMSVAGNSYLIKNISLKSVN